MNMHRIHTLLAAAAAAALVACGGGGASNGPPLLAVDAQGVTTINSGTLAGTLAGYALQAPLSAAESASLIFMRQEEQLAHDVYIVSAALWPQPLFSNIAASEATHAAAVATLLTRYAVPDPQAALPAGTFATPAFQALYDSLVAASRTSLLRAVQVGLQIEELDIHDLQTQRAAIDNADILMVYDNLMRGSRNHLRSFWRVLQLQGGSYTPQYLTPAEFDAIVSTPIETGP